RAVVVSIGVKAPRTYLGQVWIREKNESEPPLPRREPEICRRSQGRFYLLGRACQTPDYRAGGDRRIGGVKLIWALARNCGNQSFRCQGRSTSDRNREASVPKRSTGTDRPVRAMKAGNAAGAKGLGQAAASRVQLATGGNPCLGQSLSPSRKGWCTRPSRPSRPTRALPAWTKRRSKTSKRT